MTRVNDSADYGAMCRRSRLRWPTVRASREFMSKTRYLRRASRMAWGC